MNRECVRAYLWNKVIWLGFQPKSLMDQKSWLFQYGKSLKKFLEVGSYPQSPKLSKNSINGRIDDFRNIDICIEYSIGIKDNPRDTIHFLYAKNQLMWLHNVDRGCFDFPEELFLTQHKKHKQAIREIQDGDIEVIIDGLVCHPRVHQHIESPIDEHEIRIGGGIENPYLFLFHLRYQLCPIMEKRKAERARLINLFKNAVEINSPVSINDLMSQP